MSESESSVSEYESEADCESEEAHAEMLTNVCRLWVEVETLITKAPTASETRLSKQLPPKIGIVFTVPRASELITGVTCFASASLANAWETERSNVVAASKGGILRELKAVFDGGARKESDSRGETATVDKGG